jgi:hypothetical protein
MIDLVCLFAFCAAAAIALAAWSAAFAAWLGRGR